MLTDYHLHLRPDEDGTTSERYFTAENVERYLAAARERGIEELGVSEHVYRFRAGARPLDATRSGSRTRVDDLDAYCEFVRRDAAAARDRVRLRPRRRGAHRGAARGARLRLRRRLGPLRRRRRRRGRPRGLRRLGGGADAEEIWRRYFERASANAPAPASSTSSPTRTWSRSGAAAGRCPRATCGASTSPRSRRSLEGGSAVEISTAGLRKPVGELYPARGFAELCVEAGVPFALSSDAHLPEQVGFEYDAAVEFLDVARGRARSASSSGRERRLVPLGAGVPSRAGAERR